MKKIFLGGLLEASEISLGLWRIGSMEVCEVAELINTAYENGIDFIDTADIYGRGRSEQLLGESLKQLGIRDKLLIQTKCGIRDKYFDFSPEYIEKALDESLKRLGLDYVDVLLLHRPDALYEPEEIADAFRRLYEKSKVRYFGISNQHSMQAALLQKHIPYKLIVNQLQFSLTNSSMLDSALNTNTCTDKALDRDGYILDYCRLNDITIQAWSPLQYGLFEGTFIGNYEKFPMLNQKLEEFSKKLGIEPAAVAVSWILRHSAKMQVIAGTTKPHRIKQLCAATGELLDRKDWYELYLSVPNKLI